MRQSLRIDILPVVFVVITFNCAFYVCALNITECANITNGTYINNTRANCSYSLIYCNGEQSEFCYAIDQCNPEYNCTTNATTAAIDPIGTVSATTIDTLIDATNSTTLGTSTSTSTSAAPVTDVRAICRRGVTEKYKYPGNCNYYYYCMEGFLIVEQCPMGFAFSEPTRACTKRTIDFMGCS